MGTLYDFRCVSCRFRAEVSGNEDCGVFALVVCLDCRRLYDVVISEDAMTRTPEHERAARCSQSPSRKWKLWAHPGTCPQCGATMTRGEETLIWD